MTRRLPVEQPPLLDWRAATHWSHNRKPCRLEITGENMAKTPLIERFWPKVNKEGPVPDNRPELGRCWQWTASTTAGGYGQIRAGGTAGTMLYAHRLAYEFTIGPIPNGLQLDHLCRNRACLNPSHLEPVTNRINGLRGQSFAAINARKTHCPKGHEYTTENTVVDSNTGSRSCRTCRRESGAAYRAAKRNTQPKVARARKTHCPQGHEYTPENTYIKPNGGQRCRTCHRQKEAARWAANPEQGRARHRARYAAKKAGGESNAP
jgi:hypothetical protein